MQKEKEYEECIICHRKTTVEKDTDISLREHYIEGTGQLCRDCYLKLFDQRKSEDE